LNKTHSYKAELHRKNHIVHVLRNDPRRFRIIPFAQNLAAKKIQRYFRNYKDYKLERERIRFEQAKKRIHKNFARATIRKYAKIYLLAKKAKREQLEYHRIYHLNEINYLQTKWRAWKARPKKLDVKRFKDLFYSVLIGWKVRRIMSYLRTLPNIKEAIDFVKLK
jgi:hypothetical protein